MGGGALVVLSIVSNVSWDWRDIWPDVFLQVGSAVGLAGVLFGLERAFVKRVTDATAGIQSVLEEQREDLSELRSELAAARATRRDAEDAAVAALAAPTRRTVIDAARLAMNLGLDERFRARASTDISGYRLWLRWTEPSINEPEGTLKVCAWSHLARMPNSCEEWLSGVPQSVVFDSLIRAVEHYDGGFDPLLGLENLRRDLTSAKARRATNGIGEVSRLIERYNDELLITARGIESAGGGSLARNWQLRDHLETSSDIPVPEGVDPDTWRHVVAVACATVVMT